MSLDIRTAVQTAFILFLLGLFLSFWLGVRTIKGARRLTYFRIRRARVARGWRLIFLALALGAWLS